MTRTTRPALLVATGLILLSGCAAAPAATSSAAGIGEWPSFLPTPTAAGLAHGSAADPAMSYAGSPVIVAIGDAEVLVDLEGPSYPADTKVGADSVHCTFRVTLSGATAGVDLAGAAFDLLDNAGTVHELVVNPATPLPKVVRPGRTVELTLTTTVPSGEGFVRFYPDGGPDAAAGWDYVAETD